VFVLIPKHVVDRAEEILREYGDWSVFPKEDFEVVDGFILVHTGRLDSSRKNYYSRSLLLKTVEGDVWAHSVENLVKVDVNLSHDGYIIRPNIYILPLIEGLVFGVYRKATHGRGHTAWHCYKVVGREVKEIGLGEFRGAKVSVGKQELLLVKTKVSLEELIQPIKKMVEDVVRKSQEIKPQLIREIKVLLDELEKSKNE